MRLVSTAGLCLLTAILLTSTFARGADDKQDPKVGTKKHTLAKDKKAAVIILDFKGGFTLPRISEEPTMTILADGSVKIPAKFQGSKAYEGKLTDGELQMLLDYIITTQKFFEYDAKKVQEKIDAKKDPNQLVVVADAATTVIRVVADGKDKEASHYALGMNDTVEELLRLHAVQQRLTQVMSTVQLGGHETVLQYLKLANEKLKAEHPTAEPLTLDHLQFGGQRADNVRYASFHRQTVVDGKPTGAFTTASIDQAADGKPNVTVVHKAN